MLYDFHIWPTFTCISIGIVGMRELPSSVSVYTANHSILSLGYECDLELRTLYQFILNET